MECCKKKKITIIEICGKYLIIVSMLLKNKLSNVYKKWIYSNQIIKFDISS